MPQRPDAEAELAPLKVHITLGDVVLINILVLPRSSTTWITSGFILALGCIGGLLTAGTPSTVHEFLVLVTYVGVVVMVSMVTWFVFILGFALLAARAPGVLGEHVYTFQNDGLREETDVNDTLIKWGGAHDLQRTASFIVIRVSPALFHVLPRRSFASMADFEVFWSKAQALKRRAAPDRS